MLILPSWLIASALEKPLAGWGVRVVGSQIVDVAPNKVLMGRYAGDELWEAGGQVLAPGFVDTHTHLYGILAHGIPLSNAPDGFMPFLEDFWWPLVENQLDLEMICAATDTNCAAMIQSGMGIDRGGAVESKRQQTVVNCPTATRRSACVNAKP